MGKKTEAESSATLPIVKSTIAPKTAAKAETKLSQSARDFVSALAAVLGAIVLFTIGNVAELSASVFLPMAAGGFIYIAVADLIPELQKTTEIKYSALQTAGVIAGVLAMILLTFLE